jgi:aminoglycoside phosphotransferase (APT) family kinase protein
MGSDLQEAVRSAWPAATLPLVSAGSGDYAQAYRSGGWMILHARHPFASTCLERVAWVTRHLAPGSPIPLPEVRALGDSGGRHFIVYRAVPGEPLGSAALGALDPVAQDTLSACLAALLRHLRQFSAERPPRTGLPECLFPLAFEEERMREGEEQTLYAEDLRRLAAYAGRGLVTPALGDVLAERLDRYLTTRPEVPSVLLHGELSAAHLLVGSDRTVWSGVIDFNGLHLGRPARDLMYLYDSYGEPFVRRVLAHLPDQNPQATLDEVRFLHGWHLLARLLWALEHDHAPGRARWHGALWEWLAGSQTASGK